MAIRFNNYNLSSGMNTRLPSNMLNGKAINIVNLTLEQSSDNTGLVSSVPIDNTTHTFSGDVKSACVWYDGLTKKIISVAGTGLYVNDEAVKTVSDGKFSFVNHNSAIYCFSSANTPIKVTHGGAWLMGCPAPTSGPTVSGSGAGNMYADAASNVDSRYNIKVTYVTEHKSSGGGAYRTEGNPSPLTYNASAINGASLVLTSIPTYSGNDYNVVARRIYIQGGKTPSFPSYYRAYVRNGTSWSAALENNTVTSATISIKTNNDQSAEYGVDRLIELETDNGLPPHGAYGLENFDHFVISGISDNPDFWYYSKISSENFPTLNYIKDRSDIMGMVKQNNVVYTPLRDGLYLKSGSTESNFYNQDTEVADGCVAPYTVTASPFGVAYLSYNGISLYTGTQEPSIISADVDPDFQNLPTAYYENACGIYFDGKAYISVTEEGSTTNNVTWIYDTKSKGWSKLNQGYTCFAKDNKTYTLYGGVGTTLVQIMGGTTYRDWEYHWGDQEIDPDIKGTPKGFEIEINTRGQDVTVTPYYDRVAQTPLTINTTSRTKLYRRLPPGMCSQITTKLSQSVSSVRTDIYNFTIDVEI